MTDKTFVDGVIFKLPRDNAPDFVKGSVSINMRQLIDFAKVHHKDGWLNLDLKVSKNGKAYAELDTWEPKKQEKHPEDEVGGDMNQDIPF